MSWVRNVMYSRLRSLVVAWPPGRMLVLGGRTGLLRYVHPAMEVEITNLPRVNAEATPYADESWDYIVSDQMLEHVAHPWLVAREHLRILRPGGAALCTTCFFNGLHGAPHDYYRYSVAGLRRVFDVFPEVVAADSWGNKPAIIEDLLRGRKHLTHAERCAALAVDDKRWPWVVWIVVRKGGGPDPRLAHCSPRASA